MPFCNFCGREDVPHHMTKCTKCGGMMCAACLYLPSINAPCHCASCRVDYRPIDRLKAILRECGEIQDEVQRELGEAPLDSVAFGAADGAAETVRRIIEAGREE